MVLLNDLDDIPQGATISPTDAVWGTPTGATVTITSVGSELPVVAANDFFEVRDHSDTVNNGLYQESGGTPTAASITADKISGSNPIANAVGEAITTLGNTTTEKVIFYDTAARETYLLKQGLLSDDGVLMQAVYSRMMVDWKDDNFLVAAAPFPMLSIDADAGKYFIGQDASGNNNGWRFKDVTSPAINTRKLPRSAGWTEVNSAGVVLQIFAGMNTLGAFEDPVNDNAYYFFGTDTSINNSVFFDFNGPVNEAILVFDNTTTSSVAGTGGAITLNDTITRSGGSFITDGYIVGGKVAIANAEDVANDTPVNSLKILTVSATVITVGTVAVAAATEGFDFVDGGGGDDSIVRNDGRSWIDEGYKVGGNVVVRNATTGANNGTYVVTTLTAGAVGVATASLTADTDDNAANFAMLTNNAADTTITMAVDNRNAVSLRLRVRDGDPNGKTFGTSDLIAAGETVLANRLFKFGLANATDLKISETDANIDANTPYTGMTLTIHPTAQSLGGAGELVGGPYNFGFVIDCNNGTDIEVYEWVQRQLRKATDIDADAGAANIGLMLDGLMRFLGDSLEAGSVDGGLTFPVNPDAPSDNSGVFLDNLNAASKNSTTMFDNLGTVRGFPIGTTVTLDFNQVLIDDTLAEYTLFFDWTIKTNVTDLIVTAGTGANGTFDSVGANLPATLDAGVGAYVRLEDLTGGDAAMNGIYQVTALTSTSQWNVTRYDGATIVTTATAANDIDEHPFNSPDAIIVDTNVPAPVTGLASADFVFTFDYSNNVQGGRTAATDATVKGKAIGQATAQYTESSLQTIESGVALIIPFTSQQERNFNNP